MAAEPDTATVEAMKVTGMADDGVVAAAGNATDALACCCGSPSCVVLRHNSTILDNVESDVFEAAKMGKALLIRHEAYMKSAEKDRLDLVSKIEHLEMTNKELEAENAKKIEENRTLLNELEALNSTVSSSEDRIKSLEATILSSQQTIRRLENETERASSMERQLLALEEEQASLLTKIVASDENTTSAISRWRRAERDINSLEEMVERMEKEAKETRERHAEIIGRMEKQREVERALDTAAGRLKAAAAAKSVNQGSSVVSHVVRELLDDNLALQHSIAELREMLDGSNSEIQALREQLMFHQPLQNEDASAASTLRAELAAQEEEPLQTISEEVHIHHHLHYHAAPKAESKKPRKKRPVLTPAVFTSPLASTPPTAPWRPQGSRTPKQGEHTSRWSTASDQQSEFALSSAPSSPRSSHRHSALFDLPTFDSIPASPTTSVDPVSPSWRAHRKNPSSVSARSFQLPTPFSLAPPPAPKETQAIVEENDDPENVPDLGTVTDESTADDESTSKDPSNAQDELEIYLDDFDDDQDARPRLRRVLSHESILSLSGGLDIHTLKSRPSQLTLRHLSSTTSLTARSAVTAQPMLTRDAAKRSSALLRDSYNSLSSTPVGGMRSVSGPLASTQPPPTTSKLSNWVGWAWRSSNEMPEAKADKDKDLQGLFGRSPGINQPGAIPGFTEYWAAHQKRTPSKVLPDIVDQDALRDGLTE